VEMGSQSPENGSRLCKLAWRPATLASPSWSQSPENRSRLCKKTSGWTRRAWPGSPSQSPENGSRLCKALGGPCAPPSIAGPPVAIP